MAGFSDTLNFPELGHKGGDKPLRVGTMSVVHASQGTLCGSWRQAESVGANHMGRIFRATADSKPALPLRIERVLEVLFEAANYACDIGSDVWDFAVEIGRLRELGLNDNDLRWLIAKRYVDHALEITVPGDARRLFKHGGSCTFSKRTAFVLSDAAVALAEEIVGKATASGNGRIGRADASGPPPSPAPSPKLSRAPDPPPRPGWDRDRHELRVGDIVVKAFKLPSPNQETVLSVFEEEGWPVRIDDPLPPQPELCAKRRLHDTIKALNRNQKNRLVHFLGDGTGEGVRWEFYGPGGGSRDEQHQSHETHAG